LLSLFLYLSFTLWWIRLFSMCGWLPFDINLMFFLIIVDHLIFDAHLFLPILYIFKYISILFTKQKTTVREISWKKRKECDRANLVVCRFCNLIKRYFVLYVYSFHHLKITSLS
jgi:hypothetical protein